MLYLTILRKREALYILKNNNMEAVMLSFDEYKYLHNLEEMFEQMKSKQLLKNDFLITIQIITKAGMKSEKIYEL